MNGVRSPRPRTARRALLSALVAVLTMASVLVWAGGTSADAEVATGGTGRFRSIDWLTWGADGAAVTDGSTSTQTITVGGEPLVVTCTLQHLSGPVRSYRSGDWRGDGFDDLYNIGGTGGSNQLVAGLANATPDSKVTFDLTCGATLAGEAISLPGLVMADAESSKGSEYVGATISSTATWRILDRIRGAACPYDTYAYRQLTDGGNRLELHGPAQSDCENNSAYLPDPSAVAYMDGTSSATDVTIVGHGTGAIALGVMLPISQGDAPDSYGDAAALLTPTFTGGGIPLTSGDWSDTNRGVPVFGSIALADEAEPANRLGDSAQADDSVTFPDPVEVTPGSSYTSPPVSCHGSGTVAGWIDWNGNGTFDSDEESTPQQCDGSVTLTWSKVPSDVMSSGGQLSTWSRLRMFGAGDTISPTGVSLSGEVEDRQLTLTTPPSLTVDTTVSAKVSAADQLSTSVSTGTGWLSAGSTPVISQSLGSGSPSSLDDYVATLSCVDTANSSATVPVTGVSGRWTLPALADGQRVRCTVTDTPRTWGALSITQQVATPVDVDRSGTVDAGDTVGRTYTVTNTGTRTVTGIGVTDALASTAISCASTILAAGASTTCTPATGYPITAADAAAGVVVSRAVATGTDSQGTAVSSAPSTASTAVSQSAASAALTGFLAKTTDANRNGIIDTGDSLTTYYIAANDGPLPVTGATVSVTGARTVSCTPSTIAPGGLAECGQSVHKVTAAETKAGTSIASATLKAVDPAGAAVTDTTSTSARTGRITAGLRLSASVLMTTDRNSSGLVDAGDTITYTFGVRNASATAVKSVAVTSRTLSAKPITCTTGTIKAGGSATCRTVTHTITSAEVATGAVTATITASAKASNGRTVASPAVTTRTVTTAPTPRLILTGSAAASGSAGLRWTYRVANVGNVPVTAVAVSGSAAGSSVSACGSGALKPGAVRTCTSAIHTVTAAETTAGSVAQSATASALPPAGGSLGLVTSPVATTSTRVATSGPGLQLTQTAAAPVDVNADGLVDAGDTVTYTLAVRNTGDVGVSGLTINAPALSSSAIPCARTWVAAGRTVACATVVRTITAADVTAGFLQSRATAAAVVVTATGTSAVSSDPSTASVATVAARGVVALSQTAKRSGASTIWVVSVANAGNVTLTGLAIADADARTYRCATTILKPGAVTTCTSTAQWPTSVDRAAGFLSHTAVARAYLPSGAATPAASSTIVTAP